ncbi:DNA/RNA non-specific endonuclease [Lachnotalea glycerini]|uniref:DNA/RNA non-specific endonuclease n=1 Tax=Lachnotalea glycerini TaxID=1763509 RepID=A0A318EK44_9FIRM|nr:DNA/RNA non-specific endonuclease [Lachnotalea glycerini]PXV88425.1 DNA/RNA non-specific endonuclease [Lachnotalea glycerini]
MKQKKLLWDLLSVGKQIKGKGTKLFIPFLITLLITGCSESTNHNAIQTNEVEQIQELEESSTDVEKVIQEVQPEEPTDTNSEKQTDQQDLSTREYNGDTYTIIEVDGGDLSGDRLSNVAVDIGFGDREYWAYTNEYGQLTNIVADKILLQDDETEQVNSDGRYYNDEAKVPGTEATDLDEGHVIADSLGGVSNAYNITPQNSTLNRHGDQAYMEKVIRDAGGCENFVATITYPDTETQIPSHYNYTYVLNGETITDDFDNVNPDEINAKVDDNSSSVAATSNSAVANNSTSNQDSEVVEQVEEAAASSDETSIEVHITNTGKKYHSAGCQYLSKSDIITTLDKAKASGLEPCSKCNPPQ